MDDCRLWASIADSDLNEDVFRFGLGVFDEDIKVAIRIKNTCMEQFILGRQLVARSVGVNDWLIRVCCLRILVEVLHVRVRWRAIEVEVVLLDVLAMITFAVGKSEQTFLQDRILAIPQRECETKQLAIIGDARESVLTPAVSSVLRIVVGEVIPGIPIGTVIFAHGSPLALTEVWSPFFPRGSSFEVFLESGLFGGGLSCLVRLTRSLPV